MEKLMLVDGNSIMNRAFYAIPPLNNKEGTPCNALYGFTNILIKLILEVKPEKIVVAFDKGGKTFRHNLFLDYKGTRKPMPDDLRTQMPLIKEILSKMNVTFIEETGVEADDIIGCLAKQNKGKTIIVSGDKDLLQLIDENTEVWLTKKGVTDIQIMNESSLLELMHIKPYQIVELKALMGDSSDNIPGVAGVGEKTAVTLLEKYDNIENLYNHIDEISGKLKEKLILNKETAFLSKTLATIDKNIIEEKNFDDFKYDFPLSKDAYNIFLFFDFNSIIKRNNIFIENVAEQINEETKNQEIKNKQELEGLIEEIKTTRLFSFYFDTNLHVSLSKYKEYTVLITQDLLSNYLEFTDVLKILKPIFEDENIKKICFNLKEIKHQLLKYDINLRGGVFDCTLAEYLLSGSQKSDNNIKNFLLKINYNINSIASGLFFAYLDFTEKLKLENMFDLYYNIELPLVEVLFQMETSGFKIDVETLDNLNESYKKEEQNLVNEIYDLAGIEFNINSPKQLSDVLFNKLFLSKNKKESTGVEELTKLRFEHPIIDKILRYRKIAKLVGTYLQGFKNVIDSKTNLVHTVFNQTLTATGRLSSSEPNLQNLPIRDSEGKKLRKMFISRFINGKIVSADYSQIELRILAHLSQDVRLLQAYKNNLDIHAQTASDIFQVPLNMVTSEMRRDAKTVNFGIIYGISDFGLSENLGCSRKMARDYIERYFETYKGVKNYLNNAVENTKKTGYAVSLMGRKRKVDEISSSTYLVRQFGERVAMNMPIQATASDIIKLAMVNVFNQLKQEKLESKLILQIHDELIIDATETEVEKVKQILKNQMENCIKLSVPLKVDVECGDSFFFED